MKRIFLFLAVIASAAVFQSCEGDAGPPGPQGPASAEVFEVTTTFNSGNAWGQTYGLNPVILPSDNILVYALFNTDDSIDTWGLLPQVYYFDQGQAQYNFSFSYDQFTLFIESDFQKELLPANFTTAKVFRIVIVPGDFSAKNANSVNPSDYNAVIKYYNIDDTKVKTLK